MTPLIDADLAYKRCNNCLTEKELKEFPPNKQCKGGVTGTCRQCYNKKVAVWYRNNRARRQAVANEKNRKRKRQIVEHFGGKCQDCLGVFPQAVYQFHHLDPSGKDVNPSEAMTRTEKKMWEELDKCVMLCANCHIIRHRGESEDWDAAVD